MEPSAKSSKPIVPDIGVDIETPNLIADDGFATDSNPTIEVKPETSNLSISSDFFDFYYIDGFEDADQMKAMLFGKTRTPQGFKSCCVAFEKMNRNLLIIPASRTHSVEADSLYESCFLQAEHEVNSNPAFDKLEPSERSVKISDISNNNVQREFIRNIREELCAILRCNTTDIRMKWVTRGYAFERAGMERGTNLKCLKVIIPYSHRNTVPPELCNSGGKFFSHVFNARQSVLETLILKKRISGPCWLRVYNDFKLISREEEKKTWCDIEVACGTHKSVRTWNGRRGKKDIKQAQQTNQKVTDYFEDGPEPADPPLKVMALNMKTRKVPSNDNSRNSIPQLEPLIIAGAVLEWQVGRPLPLLQRTRSFVLVRGTSQMLLPPDLQMSVKNDPLQQCNNGIGLEAFRSEGDLLEAFLLKMGAEDPDVIVAHNAFKGELELLRSRFLALKIRLWSKMSRMKRSNADLQHLLGKPSNDKWSARILTVGRLPVDTLDIAQEFARGQLSYDLTTLTANLLNKNLPAGVPPRKREMFDTENIDKYYRTGRLLLVACKHALTDCSLSLRLCEYLGALPLTRELTSIAGNLWVRSLQGARAERNEWLLLHEFWRKKFIVPDKKEIGNAAGKSKQQVLIDEQIATHYADADDLIEGSDQTANAGKKKAKAAYLGGLVLEPKTGLYTSYILLLDFNSLYPSIIQEFNLCFTTVDRPNETALEMQEDFEAELPDSTDAAGVVRSQGVLPNVLESLVRRRRDVKKLMAEAERKGDTALYGSYNVRQTALKLTANSMYGCLGFAHCRFFCRPLAALVTRQGRKILQNAKSRAESELRLEVVYGDTDSIMIDTRVPAEFTEGNWKANFDRAWALGLSVKTAVNKLYSKLELDIDGIFGRLLLLKKKKYAAVTIEPGAGGKLPKFKEEFKGLDMVRRDWCPLSKSVSEHIIRRLLSHEAAANVDDAVEWMHEYLRQVAARLDRQEYSLDELSITKSLTKPPNMYPDAKSQPHVQVALRIQERTGRQVKAGDLVPYIIALPPDVKHEVDPSDPIPSAQPVSSGLASRAFAPDEFKGNENLKPDIQWYKSNQLLAPITRVLQPIQQTSQAQIAECLGLDGSKYISANFAEGGAENANDGRGWEDLSCLPIHEALKSKERFRHLSLPSVACPSIECSRVKGRILLIDLLKGGSCKFNDRLVKSKDGLTLKGLQEKAAFRCPHCQHSLPASWVRTQVRLVLTNWLRTAEREFRCIECEVTTQRTTLVRGHRCPQPPCFDAHVRSASLGGNELKAVLNRHRLDLYIEYMLALLDENLFDPDLKDSVSNLLTVGLGAGENDENVEKKENNTGIKIEAVAGLSKKIKEDATGQQILKELRELRKDVQKILLNFRKYSEYQRLNLKTLFSSCL